MAKSKLSGAAFVTLGYGQVEPNHLSAQRTGRIYAQLPAAADIEVLENGQFVKYDYANGEVNFTGKGEWMLVFNEIKLYRDLQADCEFAMVKDNYQARVYSPFGSEGKKGQTRYYNGVDAKGNDTDPSSKIKYDDVTAKTDIYELHYNENPFGITGPYSPALMPEGTTMVPRVFKTNVGDIYTTNTINADENLKVTDLLTPGADGILAIGEGDMTWEVVKIYDLPDGQRAAKIMRIK